MTSVGLSTCKLVIRPAWWSASRPRFRHRQERGFGWRSTPSPVAESLRVAHFGDFDQHGYRICLGGMHHFLWGRVRRIPNLEIAVPFVLQGAVTLQCNPTHHQTCVGPWRQDCRGTWRIGRPIDLGIMHLLNASSKKSGVRNSVRRMIPVTRSSIAWGMTSFRDLENILCVCLSCRNKFIHGFFLSLPS